MKFRNKLMSSIVLTILVVVSVFANAQVPKDNGGLKLTCSEAGFSNGGGSTVTVTVSSGHYDIKSIEEGHEVYTENFGRLLVPGKPSLPSRIFSIAIPPGAKVTDVNFDTGEGIALPEKYEIAPASLPRAIGSENPYAYGQNKKMCEENHNSAYGSDDPYPPSAVEFVRTSGYRGYNLVDVRVTPFAYRPLSGRLTHYPETTIHVNYEFPGGTDGEVTDSLERTERIAEEIIFNYDQAKNWYPKGASIGRGTHDYVIITLDSLTSSVTPLVDWETSKGRTVEVVTTSWIDANYGGYDLAEKMRNFLRDKYPSGEWGIEDVLLVGHYDDVPMRRTWQDVGYGKPETDFYYAELSLPDERSWDADGDHNYGEDSDPIDFYSEVNVGRIPWSDAATVLSICEKSVAYEQNSDPSYKKNILLLGAFFWDNDPNPRTDNAVLMEAKVDQPWMSDWTMTRMYEEGYSTYPMDYDLRNTNVNSIWSSGKFAFVNWAGHGSPTSSHIYHSTGEAFISTADCPDLNDNYPAIIFADACSNSDTDHLNLGQAMLKQGAVGFVGATKVAYGAPGWNDPSDGSGQSLDYFFTTCVTSGDYTQGEAHQWALREMYTNGLWSNNRYETFEWGALWGNPNLGMPLIAINNPPEILDVQAIPYVSDVGEWVNISCNATADAGLNFVNVNITYPDDSTVSQPMVNIPGTDDYYFNNTYLSSGMYSCYIWAKDTENRQNVSETHYFYIGVSVVNIQLKTGWNLITFPVENSCTAMTLSENITGCLSVSNWDSTNQTYKRYIVGGPPDFDFPIKDGCGYFVDADQDSTLTLSGAPVPGVNIPLRIGWNLIGWYHDHDTTAISLSENISGCSSVSMWDNNVHQTYKRYIVGGPSDFDFTITQGMSLFVDVTSESSWHGEG